MKKWADKPYYSLDHYLKTVYGEKIYKIALDAGMTCPNRDGTLSTGGCIFCSAGGSGEFASKSVSSIREQLENGKKLFGDKITGSRYIAYFQSYTNTYAPTHRLNALFTESLQEPNVVGISIGTRPDCINDDCLTLLADLKKRFPDKFIWIELGLQTIHEDTALLINRGYKTECFDKTVQALHRINIPVIAHLIIGLPGETLEHNLKSVKHLNALQIDGIKLHMLHVIEGTALSKDKTLYPDITKEQYIDILITLLEHLSEKIVIHRLTGDGPKSLTLAPKWSLNKRDVLNTLHSTMLKRITWQGRYYIESDTTYPL